MAVPNGGRGLSIRPGSTRDIEQVLAMWREAGAVPSTTDDVEGLSVLLAHDPGALIVADDDGRIVGSIIVGWDGWRGAFHRLAVAPDKRRGGVARRLVHEGEQRLLALGARRSAAVVVSQHDYAVRFWEYLGYQPDGWAVRYVKNVGQGLTSDLDLTDADDDVEASAVAAGADSTDPPWASSLDPS